MAKITVLRPDLPAAAAQESIQLAERRLLPEHPVIGLIDNGKPFARELLELLAKELRPRLGEGEVEVLRKPSSGYPITGDQATKLAARAHLVITGVGD